MREVKIFTKISYGGNRKKSMYGACIEFITSKGKAATGYYYGELLENVGFNQVILVALVTALSHLTTPCHVTAYVQSNYVENMLNNGYVKAWEKNGWKTARGEPVACVEQWQQLMELLNVHTVVFASAYDNEYTQEMDKSLKEKRSS